MAKTKAVAKRDLALEFTREPNRTIKLRIPANVKGEIKPILVATVGNKIWDPTLEELQGVSDLCQAAIDDVGKSHITMALRDGIKLEFVYPRITKRMVIEAMKNDPRLYREIKASLAA